MFSEKKEFMRSIRMTKTIKDYVEQAEGNGFNDKFEKLVLKCKKEEPELDHRIAQKKEELITGGKTGSRSTAKSRRN